MHAAHNNTSNNTIHPPRRQPKKHTNKQKPKPKENIEGKALSSASIKLKTPDRDEITIYLWIKWQTP